MTPTKVELLLPDNDVVHPEFSIVVPAMNEELSIGPFLEWCHQGIRKAGIQCEILIVDSSGDRTPQIALAHGARVLRTPKRGLGRAYIDAIPYIRSKYVIMGDADCTYDFRELDAFVAKFREGYEYIMGSRVKGVIEKGSMPALNRYFGKPLTNFMLNRAFKSNFSDIHCGMRGVTRDALIRMNLRSQSWEYASELVIKSVQLSLRTTEVPINFLKETPGRQSHMVREGWLTPWRAGWVNVRAMCLYGVDFLLYRPGVVLTVVGLALVLPAAFGPISIGPISLSTYWMLAGMSLAVAGVQALYLTIIARVLYDYNDVYAASWLRRLSYNKTAMTSGGAFLLGCGLTYPLVRDYVSLGYRLPAVPKDEYHLAIVGLLLVLVAFITFTCTVLLHALAAIVGRGRR